jgi:TolA-binding protein
MENVMKNAVIAIVALLLAKSAWAQGLPDQVRQLQQQVLQLQTAVQSLQQANATLTQGLAQANATIATLQNQNQTLNNILTALQTTVAGLGVPQFMALAPQFGPNGGRLIPPPGQFAISPLYSRDANGQITDFAGLQIHATDPLVHITHEWIITP